MRLAAFTALCLGIAVEILILWEQSGADAGAPTSRFATPMLSTERLLIGVLFAIAMVLIAIFELSPLKTQQAYMGQWIIDGIFTILGLFLFYYGIVHPKLLPRINEHAALSVHTTVMVGFILNPAFQTEAWIIALVLAPPTLVLLYMGLSYRPLAPLLKAGVYLWYLICLLALTLQNDFSMLTQPVTTPIALSEAFIVGAAGVFLLLHGLFLVRFLLIVSTVILPRNWRYIKLAMPRLFSDEQVPRWQVLVLQAGLAGILVFNKQLDLASNITLVNVLVLAIVHGTSLLNEKSRTTSHY